MKSENHCPIEIYRSHFQDGVRHVENKKIKTTEDTFPCSSCIHNVEKIEDVNENDEAIEYIYCNLFDGWYKDINYISISMLLQTCNSLKGCKYYKKKNQTNNQLDNINAGVIHAAAIVFDIYRNDEIAIDILQSSNISKEEAIQNPLISRSDRQKMILLFKTESN